MQKFNIRPSDVLKGGKKYSVGIIMVWQTARPNFYCIVVHLHLKMLHVNPRYYQWGLHGGSVDDLFLL